MFWPVSIGAYSVNGSPVEKDAPFFVVVVVVFFNSAFPPANSAIVGRDF